MKWKGHKSDSHLEVRLSLKGGQNRVNYTRLKGVSRHPHKEGGMTQHGFSAFEGRK
jgi:hypothetical protein